MKFIIEAINEMVFCAQKDENWCIVDARSSDVYIGWARDSERAGHIPYARLFSAEWLKPFWRESSVDYEVRLELQMESQGITPDKHIIVYDENGEDAEKVLEYFASKGISNLYYYHLKNWDDDLFKYPNYRLVIPVWAVKDLIDGRKNRLVPDADFKIFEVDWKEPSKQYLDAHIPGAVHIDTNEFEIPPEWTHPGDEELFEFVSNNGITPDTTVIVYANQELGSPAKLSAILRYMGVKNVMCMNGTLKNWQEAGYPTEKGLVGKKPCKIDKEAYSFERSHVLDMKEIKRMLADPGLGTVIDTRGWRQYIGEDSGYDYLDRAGRIPGTVWCWYPRLYSTPNDKMGNLEVMLKMWESVKIDMSRPMAFFCGSASWGASVCKLYGNVAGCENATIYEGGWCEWQYDLTNPIETGIPEELKDYDPERFHAAELLQGEGCHVM